MEDNDDFRKNLAKKALPRREFFDVQIGGGYSKFVALRTYTRSYNSVSPMENSGSSADRGVPDSYFLKIRSISDVARYPPVYPAAGTGTG